MPSYHGVNLHRGRLMGDIAKVITQDAAIDYNNTSP